MRESFKQKCADFKQKIKDHEGEILAFSIMAAGVVSTASAIYWQREFKKEQRAHGYTYDFASFIARNLEDGEARIIQRRSKSGEPSSYRIYEKRLDEDTVTKLIETVTGDIPVDA